MPRRGRQHCQTVLQKPSLRRAIWPTKRHSYRTLTFTTDLCRKGYHEVVHEDNQAMIQIPHTGINKTMRWLSRNHGLAIRHLYNHLGNEETKDDTELVYTRSEWMAADIYTNAFNSKDGWQEACGLVNVMDPANLREVIIRRSKIFESFRHDQK